MTSATGLGSAQRTTLYVLLRRKGYRWWRGCGWAWRDHAGQVRILESLERRGLVQRLPATEPLFELTPEGVQAARELPRQPLHPYRPQPHVR